MGTENGNGAPPYNHHRARIIVKAVRDGLSLRTARGLARVEASTVDHWIEIRPTFGQEIEHARSERVAELMALVSKGADNDPKLAERLLTANERDWAEPAAVAAGPTVRHEVSIAWPTAPTPPSEKP